MLTCLIYFIFLFSPSLSFGFSDKQTINGHIPVGLYGNGFKSGSMRLGNDAIVLSKIADTMCVGLLSQTYLQKIGAENVIVPVATLKYDGETDILYTDAPRGLQRGEIVIKLLYCAVKSLTLIVHSVLHQNMRQVLRIF